MSNEKIAIIAGGGSLPIKVAEQCKKNNMDLFVVLLKGFADKKSFIDYSTNIVSFRLGAAGGIPSYLNKYGVQKIIFSGFIKRPSLHHLFPNRKTLSYLKKIHHQKKISGHEAQGDDRLLSTIIHILQEDGFEVISNQDVLPQILFENVGVVGSVAPSESAIQDIKYGFKVSQELGRLDVGQSVVVQQGVILALEGVEGTEELIKRSKELSKRGEKPSLVKSCKPHQDKRVDMPTVGLQTLQQAYKSGLQGIALHSKNLIVLDLEDMIDFANKKGLFIYGVSDELE